MDDMIVVGVGGAGCSMAEHFQTLLGCPAIALNTDKTSLAKSPLSQRLLIGSEIFQQVGLASPARGRAAAEESSKEIRGMLEGIRLLILTTGLGGVTGSGATPVIATIAMEHGIKVVIAATLPFEFESSATHDMATMGRRELEKTGATLFIHDHNMDAESGKSGNVSLIEIFDHAAINLGRKIEDYLAKKS
jgi:cell division protein FtsZ